MRWSLPKRFNDFPSLILRVSNFPADGVPCEVIGGQAAIACNLFRHFTGSVLAEPFTCGIRREDDRSSVINIQQSLIRSRCDDQESFLVIAVLKRLFANGRKQEGISVLSINKKRLFNTVLLDSFKQRVTTKQWLKRYPRLQLIVSL